MKPPLHDMAHEIARAAPEPSPKTGLSRIGDIADEIVARMKMAARSHDPESPDRTQTLDEKTPQ